MSDQQHPRLREWFESLEQQGHAARLGMWLFLGSETLLFAGLFGIFASYRVLYPADFHAAAGHNSLVIGTVNTFVLISSSFTVAWSIHALRHNRRRLCLVSLVLTIVMGFVFMSLKMVEYSHHFQEGIYPGSHYAFEELPGQGAKLFFTLYYFLTGLHALHVLGGLCAMVVLAVLVARGSLTPEYHPHLENGGLYWHLVDVVWIFLWPLLYLAG